MDRLKLMETFVRIVRAGSLTKAAVGLSSSRALVSAHLQELENHLGVTLFNRTTRHLALTEIGAEYYDFSVRMLNIFEEEEAAISQLQMEPRDKLNVMASMSFGIYLGPVIASFIQTYPGISISLTVADSFAPRDFLSKGYDVVVWLKKVEDASLIVSKIGEIEWQACASPAYLATKPMPKTPADLVVHNCLLHHSATPSDVWHFVKAGQKHAVKVSGSFAANSIVSLRAATLSNLGIAMLPLYAIEDELRTGTVRRVCDQYTVPNRPIYVFYSRSHHMPRKIRVFIDFMKSHLQDRRI